MGLQRSDVTERAAMYIGARWCESRTHQQQQVNSEQLRDLEQRVEEAIRPAPTGHAFVAPLRTVRYELGCPLRSQRHGHHSKRDKSNPSTVIRYASLR